MDNLNLECKIFLSLSLLYSPLSNVLSENNSDREDTFCVGKSASELQKFPATRIVLILDYCKHNIYCFNSIGAC